MLFILILAAKLFHKCDMYKNCICYEMQVLEAYDKVIYDTVIPSCSSLF